MASIGARRQETALLVPIAINCLAIIRVRVIKRELDKTRQAITGAKHLTRAKLMLSAANSKLREFTQRGDPTWQRSKPSRRKTWNASSDKHR